MPGTGKCLTHILKQVWDPMDFLQREVEEDPRIKNAQKWSFLSEGTRTHTHTCTIILHGLNCCSNFPSLITPDSEAEVAEQLWVGSYWTP